METSYITAEMADDFEHAVRLGASAGCRRVSLRSKVWGTAMEDLDPEQVMENLFFLLMNLALP